MTPRNLGKQPELESMRRLGDRRLRSGNKREEDNNEEIRENQSSKKVIKERCTRKYRWMRRMRTLVLMQKRKWWKMKTPKKVGNDNRKRNPEIKIFQQLLQKS